MLERSERALNLARLLQPVHGMSVESPPPPEIVSAWVEAWMHRHSLQRPVPHDAEDDAHEPQEFLWWLLRMAERTYRHSCHPRQEQVEPSLAATLQAALALRPSSDSEHAQLAIDVDSTLRRARVVSECLKRADGPVLAVGDDDGVVICLALMGIGGLHVVDIDSRILHFLRSRCRAVGGAVTALHCDIFEQPVPDMLRGACAVVITDPPREHDECLSFLVFARAALRRNGPSFLLWVDHPDWNFEYEQVLGSLPSLGLACLRLHEDLHAYPLKPGDFPRRMQTSQMFDLDPAWLDELIDNTRGWSHLHVLGWLSAK